MTNEIEIFVAPLKSHFMKSLYSYMEICLHSKKLFSWHYQLLNIKI